MAQPSLKMGSVFPSGTKRALACSARAPDMRACVEWVSGLQQSSFRGRSSKRLKAISNLSLVEAYECKHANVNAVHGKPTVKDRVHFRSGIVHELNYARDQFRSELFRVNLLSRNLIQYESYLLS